MFQGSRYNLSRCPHFYWHEAGDSRRHLRWNQAIHLLRKLLRKLLLTEWLLWNHFGILWHRMSVRFR
jgi:hypothetical protein